MDHYAYHPDRQKILVIDNYDSFVHNLARYFRQLGCETQIVRNDAISLEEIAILQPKAIVISPGPCTPDEAGVSVAVVEKLMDSIPILGVCLGHQAIVQALGGTVAVSHQPMHGRQSEVFHSDSPMFAEINSPFQAGRYHSLVALAGGLPDCLRVTAWTDDRTIMAIEHKTRPLVGLQFHPESVLTNCGYQLLKNFMRLADMPTDRGNPSTLSTEKKM